jgi:3-hydroxy-9,10-secoandrosta-1,3,5(10)-triene-9,17-dione monooxygenase reductase component
VASGTAAGRGFDIAALRRALGCFATGVTIVTARDGHGQAVGMTASSFNAVSLEPPLVLWSIGRGSTSHDAFATAQRWAVHVLSASQRPLAERFSRRGVDRFAGLAIEPGPDGLPLLPGCHARFECRASAVHPAGDHSILVGEVLHLETLPQAPLVVHASRFAALAPIDAQESAGVG